MQSFTAVGCHVGTMYQWVFIFTVITQERITYCMMKWEHSIILSKSSESQSISDL